MINNIAWKNIWRNKSRSLIVIGAIVLGTVAGVFVNGLMKGWVDQRIRSAVYTEMSHLKIRNAEYLKNEDVNAIVPKIDELEEFLSTSPEVKSYAKHTSLMCAAQTAWANSGMMVKGIDVDKEKSVSDLNKFIIPGAGSYFESKMRNPIVISDKTAEQLKLKRYQITPAVLDSLKTLGLDEDILLQLHPLLDLHPSRSKKLFHKELDKLEVNKLSVGVITKAATTYNLRKKINLSFVGKDGYAVQVPYKVCGVFKTFNTGFDQQFAFIRQADLENMSGLTDKQVHEITIILNNDEENLIVFQNKLDEKHNGLSVMTWKELAPDAGMMADVMYLYYMMIMGIIFAALAFGIVNTMLMAIMERTKELGMLRSVGMSKIRVFKMIMLETVYLTLTGSFIGMIIGGVLIAITGRTGINFSSVGEGFEAMGWAAKVYPDIDALLFFLITLLVVIVAILSSLIPARKALKLNPNEALKMDM